MLKMFPRGLQLSQYPVRGISMSYSVGYTSLGYVAERSTNKYNEALVFVYERTFYTRLVFIRTTYTTIWL